MRLAGTGLSFWAAALLAVGWWLSANAVVIEVMRADLGQPVAEAKAQPKINVAEPSAHEPVTAGMAADRSTARPGDIFNVVVRARIADGDHIYPAVARKDDNFTPTSLNLILPDGMEALSDWSFPPLIQVGNEWGYTNTAVFRRSIKVRANATPGLLSIKGTLRCEACNDDICWPPKDLPLSTSINIETGGTP